MKRFLLWLSALALLIFLGVGVTWFARTTLPLEQVAVFERPDGRYRVVVLRRPTAWAAMPGQSSDAPGVVRLLDQRGQMMAESEVDAVHMVEQVWWGDRQASIKLVADWALPD